MHLTKQKYSKFGGKDKKKKTNETTNMSAESIATAELKKKLNFENLK